MPVGRSVRAGRSERSERSDLSARGGRSDRSGRGDLLRSGDEAREYPVSEAAGADAAGAPVKNPRILAIRDFLGAGFASWRSGVSERSPRFGRRPPWRDERRDPLGVYSVGICSSISVRWQRTGPGEFPLVVFRCRLPFFGLGRCASPRENALGYAPRRTWKRYETGPTDNW